jgi:hypothetical protein
MPKPYAKKKKICWCTPSCGKPLTAESRRRHYAQLTPAEFRYKRDSEEEEEAITSRSRKSYHLQSQQLYSRLEAPSVTSLSSITGDQDGGTSFQDYQDDAMSTDGMNEDYDNQTHLRVERETQSGSDEQMSDSDSTDGKSRQVDFCIDLIDISDSEIEIDPELEAWMKYDEDSELNAAISVDERLKEFDEMLDSGTSLKQIWESRESSTSVNGNWTNLFDVRWRGPFTARS